MKKSNLLLLVTFLSVLIFISALQLALYAKYRRGEFTGDSQRFVHQHVKLAMTAPEYLSVKGIADINFILSDTFAIEYQKDLEYPEKHADGSSDRTRAFEPRWRRNGDTLMIDGNDTLLKKTLSGQTQIIMPIPAINIYFRRIPTIELENGQAYLPGETSPRSAINHLILKNNGITIGKGIEPDQRIAQHAQYESSLPGKNDFDTLSIVAYQSSVTIKPDAGIFYLKARLHGTSTLEDQEGSVPAIIDLEYSDSATLRLSGAFIKKAGLLPPARH